MLKKYHLSLNKADASNYWIDLVRDTIYVAMYQDLHAALAEDCLVTWSVLGDDPLATVQHLVVVYAWETKSNYKPFACTDI